MEENVALLESMCYKATLLWIKRNTDLVRVVDMIAHVFIQAIYIFLIKIINMIPLFFWQCLLNEIQTFSLHFYVVINQNSQKPSLVEIKKPVEILAYSSCSQSIFYSLKLLVFLSPDGNKENVFYFLNYI